MSKTNDVDIPTGMHTRQTTRRMQQSETQTVNTEATMPRWRHPNSPTEARNLLVTRIEQYLEAINSAELTEQWRSMADNKKPSIPNALDFAVDTLKLKSIRKIQENQSLSFVKRAKFLETFSISMEIPEHHSSTEIVVEKSNEIIDPNPDSQFGSEQVSSEENLLGFCIDTYDNIPPVYTSEERISQGISTWKTTVQHPKDIRLQGFGEAPTKLMSREIAATNALDALQQAVITNDDSITGSTPQDNQHTKVSLASISHIVEIETEAEDIPETEMNTSFDSEPSGTTPQLIAVIHKHAIEIVTEKFEALLRNALDSMADLFDARINNVLDEAVERKLQSFAVEQVQKKSIRKQLELTKTKLIS